LNAQQGLFKLTMKLNIILKQWQNGGIGNWQGVTPNSRSFIICGRWSMFFNSCPILSKSIWNKKINSMTHVLRFVENERC
jgi:hypothetical protein